MSPTSGTGTMTPASPGAGVGLSLAQPIPYTLLSLPRYAKLMGINPLHFHRGATLSIDPVIFPDAGCSDIWFKYDWQDTDKVSWYQLANIILNTEQELANIVGYWPAPMFMVEEEHRYPNPAYQEYSGYGVDIKGYLKSIDLNYGKVINGGRRAVTLLGTATTGGASLVYSDEDGDGLSETATITMATALTDPREIKVYHIGKDGEQDWEIRSPRSVRISGGVATIIYDSWQLIDPDLYEDYPTTDGMAAIDVSTVGNFVTSVEVYREYLDTTQAMVEFTWETSCEVCGGSGCAACELTTQDGCIHMRDAQRGIVALAPATYNATDAQWDAAAWTNGYEPDIAKVWYLAGEQDQRYLKRTSIDPLSEFWARIIAYVATARLERPLCGCTNIQALADRLREDYLLIGSTSSWFVTQEIQTCPLGTKWGEVWAWQQIKHAVKDRRFSFAMV